MVNKGVIPEYLFENDRVQHQLEDYDEYLHTRKTQVCTPTNSEDRKRIQKEYNMNQKQMNQQEMYDIDPRIHSNSGTTQIGSPTDNTGK